MIPPGVRAVFFDAIGTLLHPQPPAPVVYAAVGRRWGSRLSEREVRRRFGAAFAEEDAQDRAAGLRTDEPRELRRWRTVVGRVLDDVADGDGCFAELFAHFARPEAYCCDAEAAAVLAGLANRGLVLGLASNFDARLHGVAAGLPELRSLRHLVVSSEVGWRKPAPQFFAAVCRACELAPAEVLFVGDDRANDHDGARAVGLHALLFDPDNKDGSRGVLRVARLSELL